MIGLGGLELNIQWLEIIGLRRLELKITFSEWSDEADWNWIFNNWKSLESSDWAYWNWIFNCRNDCIMGIGIFNSQNGCIRFNDWKSSDYVDRNWKFHIQNDRMRRIRIEYSIVGNHRNHQIGHIGIGYLIVGMILFNSQNGCIRFNDQKSSDYVDWNWKFHIQNDWMRQIGIED